MLQNPRFRPHALLVGCTAGPVLAWLVVARAAPDFQAWLLGFLAQPRAHGFPQPLALAAVLIAYPLLEEFVFRKHLLVFLLNWAKRTFEPTQPLAPVQPFQPAQPVLPAQPASLWALAANILCSLVFSASHWPAHGWQMAVAVFVPSLALGYLFLRYRSLVLNVAVHAYWNLLYLVFVAL